jgi:hypothetical protein
MAATFDETGTKDGATKTISEHILYSNRSSYLGYLCCKLNVHAMDLGVEETMKN